MHKLFCVILYMCCEHTHQGNSGCAGNLGFTEPTFESSSDLQPTGVPPECDGCTVTIQGTFSFNGQTLTAFGPPLCLSVPRAAAGTLVTATPRVISPVCGPVDGC